MLSGNTRYKAAGVKKKSYKYCELFNAIELGVIYQNSKGVIIEANPAAEHILGLSGEQLIGLDSSYKGWKAVREDGSPFPSDEHPSIIALTTGKKVEDTVMGIFNPRLGQHRWISINAFPEFAGKSRKPTRVFTTFNDITDRVQYKESFHETEDHYLTLFNAVTDAIFVHEVYKNNTLGRFIEVNDVACNRLGYTHQEILAIAPEDLDDPDSGIDIRPFVKRVIAGENVTFEQVHKAKDGRKIPVEIHSQLFKLGSKNVVLSLVRDITERKRAENAIRENETKFRIAFDNAPTGMSIINSDGQYIAVNPMLSKMFGYSEEELLSGTLQNITHPDDIERGNLWIKKMIDGDRSEPEFEKRYIHKDGHIIWALVRAQWIYEDDGSPRMSVAHILDITDRKQAEEALQASERRFRAMIEHSTDAITLVAQDGKVIYESPNVAVITGYTTDERLGRSGFETIYPEDRQCILKVFKRVAETPGSSESTQFRAVRKDGSVWWAEGTATNLLDKPYINAIVINYRDVTERKIAEEKLRLTQFGIDHSQIGIFQVGDDGDILYANEHACKNSGYTRDELCKLKIWDLDANLNMDGWRNRRNRTKKQGSIAIETMHKRKDGTMFPVEVAIDLVEFDNKKISISFVKDITDRKEAEKILRESEERFRRIFEEGQFGIAIADTSFRFINANPAFCKMFGYTRKELKSVTFSDITHPDRVENDRELVLALTRGEIDQIKVEKLYVRKNGELLWGSLISTTVRGPDDKVLYYLSMVQDITDRKKSEEALHRQNREYHSLNEEYLAQNEELVKSLQRIQNINKELKAAKRKAEESEKKYRATFYTSPDAINISTLDGKYVDVNSGFVEITGYTYHEVIGKSTDELNIWAKPDQRKSLINGLKENGVVDNLEASFIMKNGEIRTGLISAVIIPVNGKPHILSIARDISYRKKMEEDLVRAKEKAEESDRLKTAFLANMSHEIRTPMNGILGFTELLRVPELTGEQQQKYIYVIQQSGLRMLNIINDLIDISKIEAGQVEVKMERTNINKMIDSLYAFFKPEAENRNLQFACVKDISFVESLIITDETKLSQILSNLIKNALKYTDSGQVIFGYSKKNNTLEFYVKDTGPGIHADLQEKIFERFRQGDNPGIKAYDGAGLGLSITKAYVEMLGGHIWIESEEGHGSTFFFTMPYNAARRTPENGLSDITTPAIALSDITVLVADDDTISRLFLEELLGRNGIRIVHAEDGQEALEIIRSNSGINLVLMDIKMPVMNGLEATRQIKKIRPELPVIVQTAFASESDRQRSLDAGCDDYVSKPINKELLLEKICKYCLV